MKIFSLIIFLCSIVCFSQVKNDKNKLDAQRDVYAIDSLSESIIDSASIIMKDSINVKILKFDKKITTRNILKNRKTYFEVKYYFKDNNLFFVKVEEQHPYLSDLKRHSEYYITDNKIYSKNYYQNMRICLPISVEDMMKGMGYNIQLTEKFMEKYVFNLYRKIKKLKPKYY